MAGHHDFSKPETLPGKENGVHAGYDDAGELVYVGFGHTKVHKAVIDHINAEWDRVFELDKSRASNV